jgi:hypothetical protein
MHRSGTGLLARKLHECGVFMGARRNAHEEASFFLRRNQRLFHLAHAHWDHPEPFRFLLESPEFRSQVVASLRTQVRSFKIVSYLGMKRFLGLGGLTCVAHSWGWKDPRNTYTLPIWLDVFPEARVIHICRNGIDVAYSLRKREQRRAHQLNDPLFSCRCSSLEGAFGLWVDYEQMSMAVTRNLPGNRVLHLRFEDFVTAPKDHLQRIARFLGVSFDLARIGQAVRNIRPEAAFAFLKDEELQRFYEEKRVHPLMLQCAYDACSQVTV